MAYIVMSYIVMASTSPVSGLYRTLVSLRCWQFSYCIITFYTIALLPFNFLYYWIMTFYTIGLLLLYYCIITFYTIALLLKDRDRLERRARIRAATSQGP